MDLFENTLEPRLLLAEGVVLLKGFALQNEAALLDDLKSVMAQSALRHMVTPGGFTMSVTMTNCGDLGWVSDKKGYRYSALDFSQHPSTGEPWPQMPKSFLMLATQAADVAGYSHFLPDACLINQYQIAARMSLHQDKDEQDFNQPIVSVSLGVPATFLFGGLKRSDKPMKIPLQHGDVVVWGGASRLKFHGIMPLKANIHQVLGEYRFNLTFRKAG